MGRMFRVISEGPIEAVTAGAALAHSAPVVDEPFISGSVPFIEVGGPKAVFHAPKAAPIEQTPPPRGKDYLKVAFEALAPKHTQVSPVASEVVAFHQPNHPASAAYRSLADEMKHALAGGPKAVAFVAAGEARGTTTVVLNLAVTLAAEHRVLVLDADFTHDGAAKKLGTGEEPGLAEALAHTQPLAWLVQPTAVEKLHVLAAGRNLNVNHLGELDRVIATLRAWYDFVLVDGGVLHEQPARDAALAAHDAVYVVARSGESILSTTAAHIARSGGVLRGCVTTAL